MAKIPWENRALDLNGLSAFTACPLYLVQVNETIGTCNNHVSSNRAPPNCEPLEFQ